MKLRGIEFGHIMAASGMQGFFGEGYWFHRFVPGLNFRGCTFVSKTTTLHAREGNMPLRDDGITPKEWFPQCIHVSPADGVVVNSVGLSGPGALALFSSGRWQMRRKPFMISFMSIKKKPEERLQELREFVRLCLVYFPGMNAPVGLQINFSCPNVGVTHSGLVEEVGEALEIASVLNVPLMAKLVLTLPVEQAAAIAESPYCDALCVTNTVRYGDLPGQIHWIYMPGEGKSPLMNLDPENPDPTRGGLSGWPLLRLNAKWIEDLRKTGCTIPINAVGGIMRRKDVQVYKDAGADSVSIGSVAMLRGWRVRGIIKKANKVFG